MQSKFEMREYIQHHNELIDSILQDKDIADTTSEGDKFSFEEQRKLMLTVEPELSEDQQMGLANDQSVEVRSALAERDDLSERVATLLSNDNQLIVLLALAEYTPLAPIQENLANHPNLEVRSALRHNVALRSRTTLDKANAANHKLSFMAVADFMTEAFKKKLGIKHDNEGLNKPLPLIQPIENTNV